MFDYFFTNICTSILIIGQIRCGTVYNASKVCLNKDISVINQFKAKVIYMVYILHSIFN